MQSNRPVRPRLGLRSCFPENKGFLFRLPQQYEVTILESSFPGLVRPVLGALKLPGRASIVLGRAKSVLGTP
jgi:hypothetical protein